MVFNDILKQADLTFKAQDKIFDYRLSPDELEDIIDSIIPTQVTNINENIEVILVPKTSKYSLITEFVKFFEEEC